MSSPFDTDKFERLNGIELGMYYSEWSKDNAVDEEFLNYFKKRSSLFDNEHLEIALALIGKASNEVGYHEIAKYMRHPYASVRLFAINTISHLPLIDEVIMLHVISTLEKPVDRLGIRELREALVRPSNAQSKILADQFLEK